MKRILLCGNCIPLAGLAARLRAQPNLMVVQADVADLSEPPGPDDLVIVEADQSVEALALLQRHPIWRLLSVDAATGALTELSSRSYTAQSVEDVLAQVLENESATRGAERR